MTSVKVCSAHKAFYMILKTKIVCVTLDHKPSHREYLWQYTLWVKFVHFSFMPKNHSDIKIIRIMFNEDFYLP